MNEEKELVTQEEQNNDIPVEQTEYQNDEQQQQDLSSQPIEDEKKEVEVDPKESFKELREKKSQAEKERDEAYYYINYVLKQKQSQQNKEVKKEEEEFDINAVPDDDLLQGNQLKKYSSNVKKDIQQIKKQNDEFIAEYRLNQEYKDFNNVLTDENVALLAKKKPWLAKRLASEPNVYDKAKEAYLAIKEFGIYSSEENDLSEKISENIKKPKDTALDSSSGQSNGLDYAHGFAHDFSKKDKARIRAMVESRIKAGRKLRG